MSAWIPPINSFKSTLDREKPQVGLYIVSTPIGNMGDITLRALHTLGNADLILCEDTRVSHKLLSLFDISTPVLAYHEHNAEQMRPKILERIQEGQTVALISDAGTPLISDPGYKLVKGCTEEGHYVTAIPGVSAPLVALTLSGLPTDQFHFAGFPPNKSAARQTFYSEFREVKGTLIVFESAKRLLKSLKDLNDSLGNREMCVARELTKKFEEIKRGAVVDLIDYYTQRDTPKGEIVLVIGGPTEQQESTDDHIKDELHKAIESTHNVKEAIELVTQDLKVSKRRVYKLALEISK